MRLYLIDQLKKPTFLLIALGVAFLLFDVNYYFMATLPGSRDEMCVMGMNLTPGNILFSIFVSILTGVVVSGMIALFALRAQKHSVSVAAVSGVGLGLGSFTMFCPICALPVFAAGSASVFFELFNHYGEIFKLVSVILLIGTLVYLNSKLNPECVECANLGIRKAGKKKK